MVMMLMMTLGLNLRFAFSHYCFLLVSDELLVAETFSSC